MSRLSLPALMCLALPSWAGTAAYGIPNFHKVNELVYRGGQPPAGAWKALADLGVKTVIDLRRENESGEHSINGEKRAVEAAGMRYLSVPMNGIVAPSDRDIARVLDVLNSGQPVFVHCLKGKDRTGTVIACYRIAHDRWKNGRALEEAKSLGLHWVEVGMKSYISGYRSRGAAPAPPVADVVTAGP